MPQYSQSSQNRLNTCDKRLQDLFNEVIKHVDCTIVCGHRNQEDQEEAFRTGHSKVRWPNSKHNSVPSLAVDVVPYPMDWENMQRMLHFAGFVRGIASQMGVKIRCGCDWNGNFDPKDENFLDVPHFEIAE